jgi:hypothetical protein
MLNFTKPLALSVCVAIAGFLSTSAMASPQFAELDSNGDGALVLNEFASVARAAFNNTDANGDGVLGPQELLVEAQRRASGGNMPPRKMVRRLMHARDANGDGVLSFPEMVSGRVAAVFRQMDADGDHQVSMAEWEGAAADGSEGAGAGGGVADAPRTGNESGGMDLNEDDPQTGPTTPPAGGEGSNDQPGREHPRTGQTDTPGNEGAGGGETGNGNPPVKDPEPTPFSSGGLIQEDNWFFGGSPSLPAN